MISIRKVAIARDLFSCSVIPASERESPFRLKRRCPIKWGMTSFVLAILPTAPPAPLHIKQEVHDVAILHEVFLTFRTDKPCFLGGVPAAVLEEVGIA